MLFGARHFGRFSPTPLSFLCLPPWCSFSVIDYFCLFILSFLRPGLNIRCPIDCPVSFFLIITACNCRSAEPVLCRPSSIVPTSLKKHVEHCLVVGTRPADLA